LAEAVEAAACFAVLRRALGARRAGALPGVDGARAEGLGALAFSAVAFLVL